MIDKPLGEEIQDGMLVRWEADPLKSEDRTATSLPFNTQVERLLVYAIRESECVPGQSMIGKEFAISDYVAHICTLQKGDEGEEINAWRIVLLGPEQQPISFVSLGVLRSLKSLSEAIGHPPPWDPAVRVLLKQVPCRGGRTYKLVPVIKEGK